MKTITVFLTAWLLTAATMMAQVNTNVQATIGGSTGLVQYIAPGTTVARPVSQEIPIPPGSTIITGPTGQVTLIPFPGVAFTLSPNSELKLESMNIGAQNNRIAKKTGLMDLVKGMVTTVIDKDAAKRVPVDFRVKTPKSVAAAVGTKYVVAQIDGVSYVKVVEGTVNFGASTGSLTSITSASGVARLNPDGSVEFVPDSALPPGVRTAMNSAPLKETTVIAGVPDATTILAGDLENIPTQNPLIIHADPVPSNPNP